MFIVNAPGEARAEMNAREAQFDIDALFRAHYRRVARMIARVVRDPARRRDCVISWESYLPNAIVRIQTNRSEAVAEGKWVDRGVKYTENAVVYTERRKSSANGHSI
jgi:hypothetical protein